MLSIPKYISKQESKMTSAQVEINTNFQSKIVNIFLPIFFSIYVLGSH